MTEINIAHGKYCQHAVTSIVIEQRIVTCDACKASLDAFTVLANIARNRRAVDASARHARNEVNRLQARVEELKREERNLKARVRRARAYPDAPTKPEPADNVVSLWGKR